MQKHNFFFFVVLMVVLGTMSSLICMTPPGGAGDIQTKLDDLRTALRNLKTSLGTLKDNLEKLKESLTPKSLLDQEIENQAMILENVLKPSESEHDKSFIIESLNNDTIKEGLEKNDKVDNFSQAAKIALEKLTDKQAFDELYYLLNSGTELIKSGNVNQNKYITSTVEALIEKVEKNAAEVSDQAYTDNNFRSLAEAIIPILQFSQSYRDSKSTTNLTIPQLDPQNKKFIEFVNQKILKDELSLDDFNIFLDNLNSHKKITDKNGIQSISQYVSRFLEAQREFSEASDDEKLAKKTNLIKQCLIIMSLDENFFTPYFKKKIKQVLETTLNKINLEELKEIFISLIRRPENLSNVNFLPITTRIFNEVEKQVKRITKAEDLLAIYKNVLAIQEAYNDQEFIEINQLKNQLNTLLMTIKTNSNINETEYTSFINQISSPENIKSTDIFKDIKTHLPAFNTAKESINKWKKGDDPDKLANNITNLLSSYIDMRIPEESQDLQKYVKHLLSDLKIPVLPPEIIEAKKNTEIKLNFPNNIALLFELLDVQQVNQLNLDIDTDLSNIEDEESLTSIQVKIKDQYQQFKTSQSTGPSISPQSSLKSEDEYIHQLKEYENNLNNAFKKIEKYYKDKKHVDNQISIKRNDLFTLKQEISKLNNEININQNNDVTSSKQEKIENLEDQKTYNESILSLYKELSSQDNPLTYLKSKLSEEDWEDIEEEIVETYNDQTAEKLSDDFNLSEADETDLLFINLQKFLKNNLSNIISGYTSLIDRINNEINTLNTSESTIKLSDAEVSSKTEEINQKTQRIQELNEQIQNFENNKPDLNAANEYESQYVDSLDKYKEHLSKTLVNIQSGKLLQEVFGSALNIYVNHYNNQSTLALPVEEYFEDTTSFLTSLFKNKSLDINEFYKGIENISQSLTPSEDASLFTKNIYLHIKKYFENLLKHKISTLDTLIQNKNLIEINKLIKENTTQKLTAFKDYLNQQLNRILSDYVLFNETDNLKEFISSIAQSNDANLDLYGFIKNMNHKARKKITEIQNDLSSYENNNGYIQLSKALLTGGDRPKAKDEEDEEGEWE